MKLTWHLNARVVGITDSKQPTHRKLKTQFSGSYNSYWDYNDVFRHKWRVFPDEIKFVK